jgi:tRNA(fMet)-specific endonuclease VapC
MSYLVDTDWLIDALVGRESALRPLESLATAGLAASVISLGEMCEGAFAFPNPEQHIGGMHAFLSGFAIIGPSDPVMEVFGRERARLRAAGRLIPDFDLLIAATALHLHLTLLTRNVRHFERVEGLALYRASER